MSETVLIRDATEDSRVALARRYLDSAEMWLRRLIEFEFSKEFGSNYFREGIVKSNIRHSVEKLKASNPSRFSRDIYATSFEQLTEIASNHEHFKKCLSKALVSAYPLGAEQLKFHLSKLMNVRNSVQHGNGCTGRQLEQATCYSNDLVDAIKEYFGSINMSRHYNVPAFVLFKDDKGHKLDRSEFADVGNQGLVDLRDDLAANLYPGDTLSVEVEVDQSFSPENYSVVWQTFTPHASQSGPVFTIEVTEEHINDMLHVMAVVTSDKAWHRFGKYDDKITVTYRVLPPP